MALTLYTKPACVQCNATKRELKKHGLTAGVDYDVVDVTEDSNALEKIKAMGFLAAPVVITETESWAGFQPDKIRDFIASARVAVA